jgi:hypothetical protein
VWVVIARATRPDAPRWPGRQLLSVVDAIVWPAAWLAGISLVPKSGLLGTFIAALAILFGLQRSWKALFRNERYRFTTWRWGVPMITLIALGALIKALG